MINAGMFTSATDIWETPQEFFEALDKEFGFELDACALAENAKCQRYYTPEEDGLTQPWAGTVWCNPPYGRQIGEWVAKAAQSAEEGATVVMLLPARTDTRWFHRYIYGKAEIRFIPGRLKFGGSQWNAPFPSMVAVFRKKVQQVGGEVGGGVTMAYDRYICVAECPKLDAVHAPRCMCMDPALAFADKPGRCPCDYQSQWAENEKGAENEIHVI